MSEFSERKIENNFNSIYDYINEETGINLYDILDGNNPNHTDALKILSILKESVEDYIPNGKRDKKECINNALKYINHDINLIESGNYKAGMINKYAKAGLFEKSIEASINYKGPNPDMRPPAMGIPFYDIPYDIPVQIQESLNWIDQFVNNDDFRDSTIFEADETESSNDNDAPSINEYDDKESSSESKEDNTKPKEEKEESRPKQIDKAESPKNGVRRKKLYIAFIEWCKEYNNKNTFGSIFDKDAFHVSYPFVPEEMRYFYRLANPMLCVLAGKLTFFPVADLRKVNSSNNSRWDIMIFAATETDLRVFNSKDKKVYRATDENGKLKLEECLGNTFDTYIQNMIKKGDILNAPLEESVEFFNKYDEEAHDYEW